jgi:hypothetical protein
VGLVELSSTVVRRRSSGWSKAPVPWPDSAIPRDVLAAMEGGGGELAGGTPTVDSPQGRKYLLGSDAGHMRTTATGLNGQLVGTQSRGAEWRGWRCAVQLDKATRSEGGPGSGVLPCAARLRGGSRRRAATEQRREEQSDGDGEEQRGKWNFAFTLMQPRG